MILTKFLILLKRSSHSIIIFIALIKLTHDVNKKRAMEIQSNVQVCVSIHIYWISSFLLKYPMKLKIKKLLLID